MNKKTILTIVGVVLISTMLFSSFAIAKIPPEIDNPPFDIYKAVMDIQTGVASIITSLGGISTTLSDVPQIKTGSETTTFDAGTAAGIYTLAQVGVGGSKAADLQVTVSTLSEDFTPSTGDYIWVQMYAGFLPGIGTNAIDVRDADVNGMHSTRMAGTQFVIYVHFAADLTEEVKVGYSYTATAESGSTIVETT